jgi:hypothetical protein
LYAAKVGEVRVDLGVGQRSADRLVELADDVGRRTCWRAR